MTGNDAAHGLPYQTHERPLLPGWIIATLRWFITLILPAFLVLTSVRLVMNEAYLWLEYHRPGFPDDPYGLTREQRLEYGPYGVRYLLNDADIDYLSRLDIDGSPAFRSKELEHMQDVKVVTRAAMHVHTGLALALLAAAIALGWSRSTRGDLRLALAGGGTLTIGLMITLVFAALLAWDIFFDGFHSILFEGNSWRFYNHDTLIRLYSEQFWFDTALVIGALTLSGAAGAIGTAHLWEKRSTPPANKNGASDSPVHRADSEDSVR